MDWHLLLFGIKGRISRTDFWLAQFILLIILLIIAIVGGVVFIDNYEIVFIIGAIGIFISNATVVIKRLHDRNLRTSWALIFWFMPCVSAIGIAIGRRPAFQRIWDSDTDHILEVVLIITTIVALVELGCRRGTIGANRYGPDPVAPKPAQH